MPLTSEDIEALTPSALPPGSVEPETDRDDMMALWSSFMRTGKTAGDAIRASREVKAAWYVGVGLVPVHGIDVEVIRGSDRFKETIRRTGYAPGGVVYTNDQMLEGPYTPFGPVLSIEEGKLPIIVRRVLQEPQAIKIYRLRVGPIGTVACWAKYRGREGCLTADHVVGSGRVFEVFGNGRPQPARVFLHSSPCLDAAYLDTYWPNPQPTQFVPLSRRNIKMGDPTRFDGLVSTGVTGKVTHFSPHEKYSGAGSPMLVFHDGLGDRGDSGSMVKINNQNAGMHLSKVTLDRSAYESRVIVLEQLASNMNLELFE